MTYSLIAINIIIFIAVFISPILPLPELKMVPSLVVSDVQRYGYTILTSLFTHEDIRYLLFNLILLYIFGDNVEDRLGRIKYLVLYFSGGIIGSIVYIFSNATSGIPLLGATGSVFCIMGAYLMLFPNFNITFYDRFIIFPYKFRVPVWFLIGGVFFFILLLGYALNIGGIAWAAHLMSFAFGVCVTLLLRLSNKL